MNELQSFPGDLVETGLADLKQDRISEAALLVLIARPRLLRLGFDIPVPSGVQPLYEHRLYEAIEARMETGAHAEYNALIQRIVSFTNAYEAVLASKAAQTQRKQA